MSFRDTIDGINEKAWERAMLKQKDVYCSCGAAWHGRYVESAETIIALHAKRDGLVERDEFYRLHPRKKRHDQDRRPRRVLQDCPTCGAHTLEVKVKWAEK